MNLENIKKEALALLKSGKPEDVIKFLRQSGCSKALSVGMLSSILACNSHEAKRMVHFSETWADARQSDEQFHAEIERIIKKQE
jgi:hypothetical protein